jgi:hypothetical protein
MVAAKKDSSLTRLRAFPIPRPNRPPRRLDPPQSRRHMMTTMSFNCSIFSGAKAAEMLCCRCDPAFKTSKPIALNFLITLRTVWSLQPNVRAIRRAVSLRALASTIWLRRISNQSCERRPVFSLSRSSFDKLAFSCTRYTTILFSLLLMH